VADAYDVIIVGSGAGGGMSAYHLTRSGLKVLMLEAGRNYDPVTETPMFNTNAEAPLRGASTPDKPFGFYDATVDGGWEVPNEPYTVAPGSEFKWWRPRMLGGRTNHWGRIALRFGPLDFKPKSRDGLGYDWPITYDDLAPWYDKTEKLIGVSGAAAARGLTNTPDSPPGCLMQGAPPRAFELFYTKACEAMGMPVIPMHGAVVTGQMEGRNTCVFATPCGRGGALCIRQPGGESGVLVKPRAAAAPETPISFSVLSYQGARSS
jgi:choline dehydrogenase-like flavoprotein